jgi:hypothetical protein
MLYRLKSLRSCLESFSTRLSFSRTSFGSKPWFTRSTSPGMEAETSASSLASRWSLAYCGSLLRLRRRCGLRQVILWPVRIDRPRSAPSQGSAQLRMGGKSEQHQPKPNAKRCDRTHTHLQNAAIAQIVLPLSTSFASGGRQVIVKRRDILVLRLIPRLYGAIALVQDLI